MSIKLGGSKSKTTESKSSTSNSTTMPIVPEWGASLTQSAAGRIGELLGQEPQSFVAPANGLQELAGAEAGRLGQGASLYGEAGDLVRGVGQRGAAANVYEAQQAGPASKAMAGSLLDNLDSYMSPYRRDVVDAALADYDFGAGQTRAQLDLDLAGSGAFGGSGSGLTRSATLEGLSRGRASTSANLLDQMFNRGAALSGQDADRRTQVSLANAAAANTVGLANQQAWNDAARFNADQGDEAFARQLEAGRGLADLASAQSDSARADIASQLATGSALRGVDSEFRQAPVTHAQQVVAMLSGLPLSLFTGEQKTGSESSTGTSKTKSVNLEVGHTFIPGAT